MTTENKEYLAWCDECLQYTTHTIIADSNQEHSHILKNKDYLRSICKQCKTNMHIQPS